MSPRFAISPSDVLHNEPCYQWWGARQLVTGQDDQQLKLAYGFWNNKQFSMLTFLVAENVEKFLDTRLLGNDLNEKDYRSCIYSWYDKNISPSHKDCGLDCNRTSRILHCHVNQLSNEIKDWRFLWKCQVETRRVEESLRMTLREAKMHGKETLSLAYYLIWV